MNAFDRLYSSYKKEIKDPAFFWQQIVKLGRIFQSLRKFYLEYIWEQLQNTRPLQSYTPKTVAMSLRDSWLKETWYIAFVVRYVAMRLGGYAGSWLKERGILERFGITLTANVRFKLRISQNIK